MSTTTAPLYPGAWNVWLVAIAGQAMGNGSVQGLHVDTQAFLTRWIGANVSDASDVTLLETPPTATVRRREQLDTIPVLPSGPYYLAAVRWFDSGPQKAIPWPADSAAMLLEVHEPDRSVPPPVGLADKLAALAKPAADLAKTVAIGLAITAGLIVLAVYVSKRPVTVRYLPEGYE